MYKLIKKILNQIETYQNWFKWTHGMLDGEDVKWVDGSECGRTTEIKLGRKFLSFIFIALLFLQIIDLFMY